MQPAPENILTQEIPVPSVERIDLRDRHVHGAYQPILQAQISSIAMSQAHIEALTVACQQQAAQIGALKERVKALEGEKVDEKINGAVRDLVGGKKS